MASFAEDVSVRAIPMDVDNPGPGIDRFLMTCSSDLQLLALGEALHGSEEILRLRNRIFQHLVEHDDFRALAIEASFPHARAMNDYVLGGPGAYEELKDSAISHGWGQYAATRELIEWMRGYNAEPGHDVKVHFHGFDLPATGMGPASPSTLFDLALSQLASLDAATAARHREKIGSLIGPESQWHDPMIWRDPAKNTLMLESAAALRVEAQKLVAALSKHRANFPSTPERRIHEEAVHAAKLARHHLSFFIALADAENWAPSLGARDAMQAETLEYIVERERPRGRVMAFAHNKHLQKSKASWQLGGKLIEWSPAGAHLAHTLGAGYAAIGMALRSAAGIELKAAEAGTLESMLPVSTLLPTRSVTRPGTELKTRSAAPGKATYFPLTSTALSDFDGLMTLSL